MADLIGQDQSLYRCAPTGWYNLRQLVSLSSIASTVLPGGALWALTNSSVARLIGDPSALD